MKDNLSNKRILLFFAFIWMGVCFGINSVFHDNSLASHQVVAACTLVSYVMCVYNWVKCGNRVLSLYNFFVIYMMFSNFGESLLFMFGFPEDLLLVYVTASLGQINELLRFQLLCAAGMNLGTILYIYNVRHCVSIQTQRYAFQNYMPFYSSQNDVLDILLFISMAYMLVMSVRMLVLRQSVDYGTFYSIKSGWDSFIGQILDFLSVLLCFFFLFKKKHVKTIYRFLIWCIFVYMLTGARSMTVRYLCIIIVMLPITHPHLFIKRLAPVWGFAAFLGFAMLSIISSYRTSAIGTTSIGSFSIWLNGLDTINEMGFSAITSILTIEEVNRGFPLHQTILNTIVNAFIPFISDFSFMSDEALHLSKWVTELAGSKGSGYGFCCIGEAYINYSSLGWLFFVFYGFFIAYAENTAYRRIMQNRYPYALFLLVFLSRQIFFARGEMGLCGGTMRLCVYAAIIVCIWQIKNNKKIAL